jgi:hypothetical protein
VGTEYHWYIIAHQYVKKLDANSYTTSLDGLKYKLAHRRSENEKWSISDKGKKKRMIKILQEVIANLEKEDVDEKNISTTSAKKLSKEIKKIPPKKRLTSKTGKRKTATA